MCVAVKVAETYFPGALVMAGNYQVKSLISDWLLLENSEWEVATPREHNAQGKTILTMNK